MPWVGPSSILMTLMASGLDGQRFRFLGYLPVHADERAAALKDLETQSRRSETQLFIETPYRNGAMLESLVSTLAPDTRGTAPRYAPSDARRKGGRDAGRPAAGRNFRPAQKKGRGR